jgi:hypothetical protein
MEEVKIEIRNPMNNVHIHRTTQITSYRTEKGEESIADGYGCERTDEK